MEVKISIPDNCVLIKNGDTYIVKEKPNPPRSWEEFCTNYSKQYGEAFIDNLSKIKTYNSNDCLRHYSTDRNLCTSKEEAEAFLALMQLRQLRRAWVGDWEPDKHIEFSIIVYNIYYHGVTVDTGYWSFNYPLTFPTVEMAKDFLSCFSDLCEKAKILL